MADRWTRWVGAVVLAGALGGCLPRGTVPMNTLAYPPREPTSGTLVVFLRGLGGSHASFEEHGFVSAVAARFPGAAMAAPDASLGYYLDRSLDRRLKEDVLDPARAKGARRVWLIGVSMGGLGAVLTALQHPAEVDGIVLISPFLGYPSLEREIARAGGLARWEPGEHGEEDWERLVWAWLQRHSGAQVPPIYLGFGETDEVAGAHRLLAAALPPDRVITVDGGHDVDTFVRLFAALLPMLPLDTPGTAMASPAAPRSPAQPKEAP